MTKTGKIWQTSQRAFDYSNQTLVMGILNVTPDSFSDGGRFEQIDLALKRAERMVDEGADIIDVGGESTRPGSKRVSADEEIRRTCPVIEAIKRELNIAVSIDTSKSSVAEAGVTAGAEIINDVSGLRFDERIAEVASKFRAGLVLMRLKGDFRTMHKQDEKENTVDEVIAGLRESLETAKKFDVIDNQICLDIGIGFSKTQDLNQALIAKFGKLIGVFPDYPMLIGVSRKSFIGEILGEKNTGKRLIGTIAANVVAVFNGANIVRVHDVKSHVEALKVTGEFRKFK